MIHGPTHIINFYSSFVLKSDQESVCVFSCWNICNCWSAINKCAQSID